MTLQREEEEKLVQQGKTVYHAYLHNQWKEEKRRNRGYLTVIFQQIEVSSVEIYCKTRTVNYWRVDRHTNFVHFMVWEPR